MSFAPEISLGVLDPATGELVFANAGQDPPLLFCPNAGEVKLLTRTGLALGISNEHVWKQSIAQLPSGDVLILYTDGVTEACNSASSPFGLGHLQACAQKHLSKSAEEIKQEILCEIHQFLAGEHPQDDVSLIVIKRK